MKDQEWFEKAIKAYKEGFKNCHLGKYELESVIIRWIKISI